MRQRLEVSLLPLCLLLAIWGCGEEGVLREPVSGTVTLNGDPLETGSILFTPLGEGPSAGGDVKQGRYTLPADRGPGPGKYRVEINAWREIGTAVEDEAMGVTDETLVSILPPRYNTQSELEATIEAGGENTFDFELQSR